MNATRKTAIIMIGIMVIEGWVLSLSLLHASRDKITGFYDPGSAGVLACLLAAVTVALFIWHAIRSFPVIGERMFDLHALKLLAIPFAVITGSMEELWFRKGVMDAVQVRGGGALIQIIASAVAFGVVHAVWGAVAGRWRAALGAMLATGALGAALAVVYLVGSRHVAPCVWAHIAINMMIEPWLLFAAVSFGFERGASMRGSASSGAVG